MPSSSPIPPPADSPTTHADIRAAFVRSWDSAASVSPEIEQAPLPCPPGYVAWRVKGTTAVTMLPQLLPHAPVRVRRAYNARVLSNLVGRCPLCGAVASINADPETHPAGWSKLDITIGISHLSLCSGTFLETDRRYFDSRAVSRQP